MTRRKGSPRGLPPTHPFCRPSRVATWRCCKPPGGVTEASVHLANLCQHAVQCVQEAASRACWTCFLPGRPRSRGPLGRGQPARSPGCRKRAGPAWRPAGSALGLAGLGGPAKSAAGMPGPRRPHPSAEGPACPWERHWVASTGRPCPGLGSEGRRLQVGRETGPEAEQAAVRGASRSSWGWASFLPVRALRGPETGSQPDSLASSPDRDSRSKCQSL